MAYFHSIQSQDADVDDELDVTSGRTDRKVFLGVLLVSLLILGFMVSQVTSGAIAIAAVAPVPVHIQATNLSGKNFHLYPGISRADSASPVAVNQMDATITNLSMTKSLSLPIIGTVNVKLTAGQNGHPAVLNGLTTDVSALNAGTANFQNLQMSSGGHGFDQNATSMSMDNVNIDQPYMMASSVTMPGLSLSVSTK